MLLVKLEFVACQASIIACSNDCTQGYQYRIYLSWAAEYDMLREQQTSRQDINGRHSLHPLFHGHVKDLQ